MTGPEPRASGGAGATSTNAGDLIYFNGIDAEMGQYAVKPQMEEAQ